MMALKDFARIVGDIRFEPWSIAVGLKPGGQCYLQVRDENGRCNVTGAPRPWSARKWMLSAHMTETEIVKTALKAVLAALEHEALEHFKYRGATVFDPHIRIGDLLRLRTVCPLDSRE